MGRRLAALLIVLTINAAMLPCAAAASITGETTIDTPVDFHLGYHACFTGSPSTKWNFTWPITLNTYSTDYVIYDGLMVPTVQTSVSTLSNNTRYKYRSLISVFESTSPVTASRFLFKVPSYQPILFGGFGQGTGLTGEIYLADDYDFSRLFRYYSISYYMVNSQDDDNPVVGYWKDYISLPFDGSYDIDLGFASSFSSPVTFDTIVLVADLELITPLDRPSAYVSCLSHAFESPYLRSTEQFDVVIDGTNETLDQFFDSYQQQYEQVSAGIVTNLNTGISTIVSEAKQQSNSNISEFIDHSGQSEQASLDWGFRNTMIAINNAGAQVAYSIGQAASSTVAATQAAAENISKNIVATGETINTTLTGLPEAIGNKVTDLFVPKAEDLAAIKDDYDGLLEEKLGAVYQVEQYGQNLFGSVAAATETDTITFPGISVPVGQGENFVMESAEVAVFPAGLDVLKNCVKFLVTAAFVAAWVLGLQRYYDKIMGDRGDE